MKRYYKHDAESEVGLGVAYLEFDGEWATRQVEIYGDCWFCSMKAYHPEIGPALIDQPFSVLELQPEQEITSEEFEVIWEKALKLCH
jgi:hypothetical protein